MNKDIIQWIINNKCKECKCKTHFCSQNAIEDACYDHYYKEASDNVMHDSLKKQSRIVKERLSYHFASTQGGWNIEGMPPFMKEFLNEVDKLCEMISKR